MSAAAAARTVSDWASLAYAPTVLVLESTFPVSAVCMLAPHTPLLLFTWRGVNPGRCKPAFTVPCPVFGLGSWDKCQCGTGRVGVDNAMGGVDPRKNTHPRSKGKKRVKKGGHHRRQLVSAT